MTLLNQVVYPSVTLQMACPEPEERRAYAPTGVHQAAPLVAVTRELALSTHFRAGDFLPEDGPCRYLRLLPELVEFLEKLHLALGERSLKIHSGYRPPLYNQKAGGVRDSLHIDGLAVDVSAPHQPLYEVYEAAEALLQERGGVGYYPMQGFVHVDLRPYRSRWLGGRP